jgi:hypothetical protein
MANIILTAYAPHILESLAQLAQENNPEFKISPVGFLAALIENNPKLSAFEQLTLTNTGGHQKRVFIKYQPRYNENVIATEDNCNIDLVPAWKVSEIKAERFVKIGIHISDEEISKLVDDASQTVRMGTPPTTLLREHIETIMRIAQALMRKIDAQLLSDVTWGVNVTTGNNAAVTVNINKDATKNDLNSGFTKILFDASENEFAGNLIIVGNGLMNSYELQKMAAVAAMNGVDVTKFTGYTFYNDTLSKVAWGVNQIGVFEKGSIGFVDVSRYLGFRAGERPNSFFFQLPLPVQTNSGIQPFNFDVQLKYIDCPTVLLNHYGEEEQFDRGWALYISKRYGLWQYPSNVYNAGDVLAGVNGSLRYIITNECAEC